MNSKLKNIKYGLIIVIAIILNASCKNSNHDLAWLKEPPIYTPEQFTKNKRISGLHFSIDGSKLLYTSDELGNSAAYYYDVNTNEKILVHSDDNVPVWGLSLTPENDLIFTSVKDGGQYPHIFLKKKDSIIDLTPGEKVRASWKGTKFDNSGLYYKSNKRSPRVFDLYFFDFKSYESKLIFENENNFSVSRVSNNDRYVILYESITEESNNLYLHNIENNESTLISGEDNEDSYYAITFSPDDNEVYYLTNHDSEFTYLEKYNIRTKKKEIVLKESWDIMSITDSDDGQFRVININENGAPKIRIQDVNKNSYLDIPILDSLQITKCAFSPDSKFLAMHVTDYNTPKDLYILDIKKGKVERIVTSLNNEINENDLAAPIDVTLKSFDGLEIPAILYKPKTALKNRKFPGLIWTHGGPGGQFFKTYDEQIQYVVNQGYVVLAVNNRGSSGYGKTFKSLDNQKHGVDDLKDCIKGKEYLQNLEYVDSEKIGIIGASYGGYLSLAALTFYPDEFQVGVDMFGISNWFNVLNNIPAFWEARRKALYAEIGNPKSDSIMLYNKSPLFFSENIKKPLLVIQGANDSKVPQSESDSIVARVRKNGTPVEYLIFDDEGHGVRKPENNIKSLTTIASFLKKHLKNESHEN